MEKKLNGSFDGSIPQIDFIKYLLDNTGRVIDDELVYEIIELFGGEVFIKPALAYIMTRK